MRFLSILGLIGISLPIIWPRLLWAQTAPVQATENQGPAHVEALWTAFTEAVIVHSDPDDLSDNDGGRARAALAQHQLELSPAHVKKMIDTWPLWGSVDFISLIRREVKAGTNYPKTLVILAGVSPDEARPLVIADLSQPDSKLLYSNYDASYLFPYIAPMPLPQLDTLLRTKLAELGDDRVPIIPLIGCFGSDKLLPDVVDAFHKYGKDWNDDIRQSFYLYWLRCDPEGGAKAFEQEIQSGTKRGWGFFYMTFTDHWTDRGLPVVRWALTNNNPTLTNVAITLLEKHGEKAYPLDVPAEAREILANVRWHLTAEQKKRLEAPASAPQSK
jgi:hypothetical protein